MLLTIVNWIYILWITFGLGIGFCTFTKKYLKYEIHKITDLLAAGIVLATVYAQFFSLFYKVGILANVILVIICFLLYIKYRKETVAICTDCWKKNSRCHKIFLTMAFLLFAYFTSRGIIHYDSDLYHAQSIRWIEEYGIVRGLGNIHVRLAYNSSLFALSALFSMKALVGQSMHSVNGLLAFILFVKLCEIRHVFYEKDKRKAVRISDFARLAGFYYLTTIFDEMVSPASDYTVICTIFYLVITWLDLLEKERNGEKTDVAAYSLLCVGGVFAVSVKLTVGLILLLVIHPACVLMKEKKWREIAMYFMMGILVIFPWMARTAIISGYLIYPFPDFDVLKVDWKIPAAAARLDAAEIKTWGRGICDASKINMPLSYWIKDWFEKSLNTTEKLLIVLDICSLIALLLIGLIKMITKKLDLKLALVMLTLSICYLFWQLSAPLVRYGYGYVLLLSSVSAGVIATEVIKNHSFVKYAFCMIFIAFGIWKTAATGKYMIETVRQPYYVRQKDYGTYKMKAYQVDQVTFYCPVNGDQSGYGAFPATPAIKKFKLKDGTIKGGFVSLE